MKKGQKSQLTRYILATLTVGMFGIVPVAYALPVQDTGYTNTTGSAINTSVANQMGITSTAANNVMNWKTFSIANGEKVQFDEKNYLNLVRGTSKSEIDGALSGTGNIYLINPNGILFGSTAQVNVGNLVASTRAIDKVDADGFAATGANPLAIAATAAAGDIVNLGKLQTASVVLEGNNITIQNATDITSDGSTALTSAVTVKAAGNITVGHAVAATTTRSFTIGGTATDKTVHDYANDTYAGSGYTGKKLDGTTDNAVKESMLVDNVYDLQNMDAKKNSYNYPDGNYMLSGNIDASETSGWNAGAGFSPVGNGSTVFTGAFDGANHTINGLYINRSTTVYVGLFGYSSGTIQNVGLVGGSITGESSVGGVVGQNSSSGKITNAYNTGAVSGTSNFVGGVVGWNSSSGTITNAYNTGAVSGASSVGGVAGYNDSGTITNVYNMGAVSGTGINVGGVLGYSFHGSITNVYNTGAVSGGSNVGGVAGFNGDTITNVYNTGAVSGGSTVGGVVGSNDGTNANITNVYNTGAVSGGSNVGGVAGQNYSGTITNAYNTGAVSGTAQYVGGVAGRNYSGTITNAYNTGAVSGTAQYVGGVLGYSNDGTITNTWYATTDAANNTINTTTSSVKYNNIGTAKKLAELQSMALTGNNSYGFDPTIWRTNATDGSTALVATTPMLQAFINKDLDSQITHTAVQYGTAEKPLTNIYQTSGDLTLDMSTLTRNLNVGAAVYGHNLTVDNFTSAANDSSTWASYAAKDETDKTKSGNLYLNNYNGFTVNSGVELLGTNSITLSAKDSSTGTIIDYGKNATPTLKITAKDIVLDTDRVDTAAGNAKTAVTLNAAGTAKAGYTPTGTMKATVNGDNNVSVPDYATANKRENYPSLQTGNGGVAISEGQWIKNVTELQAMGENTNTMDSTKTYFLYGDIDASGTSSWNKVTTDTTTPYQGFVPVGNDSAGFRGSFDGLNYTINGLYINRSETDYVGLFGYVGYGTIQNVGLVDGSIVGKNYVGGVAGLSRGTITNAYNTGAVIGTGDYVGGVAGLSRGTITNVYNTGTVSGTGWYVGGVVGQNDGTITNAYNTGAVSGTGYNVGGVAGLSRGTITNAYNTGTVSGTDGYVGGVAGDSSSKITNSYNTGAVSGTGGYGYVGGVAGNSSSEITNSYNTGAVSETSGYGHVGGVAGNSSSKITNSYNTGAVSGTGDYVGGVAGYNNSGSTITNAYNTGTVRGRDYVGGVAGNNFGTITNAYNTGAVSGTGYYAGGVAGDNSGTVMNAYNTGAVSGQYDVGGVAGDNNSGSIITNVYNTGAVSGQHNVGGVAGYNNSTITNALWANDLDYKPTTGRKPTKAVGNAEDTDTVKGVSLADMKKAATYSSWSNDGDNTIDSTVASAGGARTVWRIYESNTTPLLTSFFKSMVTVTGLDSKETTYNGTTQTADIRSAVYSPADIDTSHIFAGSGRNVGTYSAIYSDQQGYDLVNTNTLTISPKTLKATLTGKTGNTYVFTKDYDGTTSVKQTLVLGTTYTFDNAVAGDDVSISTNSNGAYDNKNVDNGKNISYTDITLTGADAGNYTITSTMSGTVGQITPKTLTATLTGDNVFTKVYDGTTTVNQALGTNYILDGIVADSDKVLLSAGSGAYDDKNAGDNKTITFSGLTLIGEGAGNYTIAPTLSGAVGQITRRTITGSLASGYSFDKVYDGTATASLGNGYTLSGVVAGDNVPLTAANGFYDSSAVGDRTVTFSGFSINDGNYLLSMADSLTGTGKISSGSQDHNYSDALAGVSSFFGTNPSGGYTIFSGAPEDYVARAANGQTRYSTGEAQAAPAGTTQESLTWYNGPTTITIINGGITLPKDILLGSTYDTRTVVIKGSDSYQI